MIDTDLTDEEWAALPESVRAKLSAMWATPAAINKDLTDAERAALLESVRAKLNLEWATLPVDDEIDPKPPVTTQVEIDDDEDVDLDFDADFTPPTAPRIRLMGQVYELPAEIPAQLLLLSTRLKRQARNGEQGSVSTDLVLHMINVVLGAGVAADLMDRGIGMDRLNRVIVHVQKIYQDRAEKNGVAPSRGGNRNERRKRSKR